MPIKNLKDKKARYSKKVDPKVVEMCIISEHDNWFNEDIVKYIIVWSDGLREHVSKRIYQEVLKANPQLNKKSI